jgi:glycosyltransferase involved in cell wall biosynthesis
MTKKLVVFPSDPLYRYYEKGEIKPRYYNPGNFFDEVHMISLCEQDIESEKVQILVGNARLAIHPIGRPTPFSFPFYFRRACSLVKAIQPHVIRGHGIWHAGSLATYAGKKLGIPTIVSLHTEEDDMRKYNKALIYRLVKVLEWYTLRNTDCAICMTKHVERFANRHGAKRTMVIYNKVYTKQFSQEVEKIVYERPTILSVMRLDPQKDPECLIRAIAGLDVNLVLIGQGVLEAHLKRLVEALELEDRVQFIPSVPNTEIHRYYFSADIFAMATHYEGFCIPVLEAMAAGLPVVVCDTNPLPEVMGGTGVIVERTPEAFRAAFRQLLADPGLRATLGAAARARAETLDGTIMESREAELYQRVMAQGRGT